MTAGAVLLLFLLVISFVIRSCGDKKAESASSQNTQTEGKNNSAKKVSEDVYKRQSEHIPEVLFPLPGSSSSEQLRLQLCLLYTSRCV